MVSNSSYHIISTPPESNRLHLCAHEGRLPFRSQAMSRKTWILTVNLLELVLVNVV